MCISSLYFKGDKDFLVIFGKANVKRIDVLVLKRLLSVIVVVIILLIVTLKSKN